MSIQISGTMERKSWHSFASHHHCVGLIESYSESSQYLRLKIANAFALGSFRCQTRADLVCQVKVRSDSSSISYRVRLRFIFGMKPRIASSWVD
jgi:hypothetical protein